MTEKLRHAIALYKFLIRGHTVTGKEFAEKIRRCYDMSNPCFDMAADEVERNIDTITVKENGEVVFSGFPAERN